MDTSIEGNKAKQCPNSRVCVCSLKTPSPTLVRSPLFYFAIVVRRYTHLSLPSSFSSYAPCELGLSEHKPHLRLVACETRSVESTTVASLLSSPHTSSTASKHPSPSCAVSPSDSQATCLTFDTASSYRSSLVPDTSTRPPKCLP